MSAPLPKNELINALTKASMQAYELTEGSFEAEDVFKETVLAMPESRIWGKRIKDPDAFIGTIVAQQGLERYLQILRKIAGKESLDKAA